MIQELLATKDFTSENNTYEIDNGYIFSDVKKGNFYQTSGYRQDYVTRVDIFENRVISAITLNLDTESKHFESTVYQLMDLIGTIGGIFELLMGAILMVYGKIRRSLYYHSIINELHVVQRYKIDEKDNVQAIELPDQPQDLASRDESKRMDHENNSLINNHPNHEVNYNSKCQQTPNMQDQIEQIKMLDLSRRENEMHSYNQMLRNI